MSTLPTPRGTLTPDRNLADLTWLRVGGPADWLFQPADEQDLAQFLAALDPAIAVFPMGVGSNLIVRDGGLRAVVIRLGRGFNSIEIQGDRVISGAAALDAHVARKAAGAGLDLTFLRTIPGSIGGAVRMNAGCYGSYVKDHLIEIRAVLRSGEAVTYPAEALNLAYRQSTLPEGCVITQAVFRASYGDPDALDRKMQDQIAKRDAFNPPGTALPAARSATRSAIRRPAAPMTATNSRPGKSSTTRGCGAPKLVARRCHRCIPTF